MQEGFENVAEITGLQGRWQVLHQKPILVADTAHNAAGIQFVAEQLKTQTYNQLRIIFGVVNDKDISAMLALLPKEAHYYFTQAKIKRALAAKLLQQKAQSHGLNGCAYLSVKQAIKSALLESSKDDFILIVGSNFVVWEALVYLKNK